MRAGESARELVRLWPVEPAREQREQVQAAPLQTMRPQKLPMAPWPEPVLVLQQAELQSPERQLSQPL